MAEPPSFRPRNALEWEYADDIDFAKEKGEPLDSLLPTACSTLKD